MLTNFAKQTIDGATEHTNDTEKIRGGRIVVVQVNELPPMRIIA